MTHSQVEVRRKSGIVTKLVPGFALVALFLAILLPPEAYPDGKLAVILCSTFVFFFSMGERRISPAYLKGGLLGFVLLLLHTAAFSIDGYRALEFITALWAYYCLFGFFYYAGFDPLKPVVVSLVVLSAIVSGYGLYQYFWGFDQLYNVIFYGASDSIVKVPALERVATRRVFSTLALPGTLWGFLVVALPVHAGLWRGGPLIRIGLAVSAALLMATGLLTKSFGFLLGLFVLVAAWLILRYRRVVRKHITTVLLLLVVLALVAGTFYSARRDVIEAANPFSLRMKNWISAWSIFAANPMGTGLGTYGVVYTQHMLPGSNETQYAHNTPLQLLSELGYPAAFVGAALVLLGLRELRRGALANIPRWAVLALLVWLVHNLIDINVYFPSVGVVGTVLWAVLLRRPSQNPQSTAGLAVDIPASLHLHGSDSPHPRPVGGLTAILAVAMGLGVVAFAGLAMFSTELQFRAKAEYEENRLQAAAATLDQATALMPFNSSLFHDSGDVYLNLYHNRRDPSLLERATSSFRRAIALSPIKAGSHTGLSLCLSSAGLVDEALEEIRTAQRLYPDSTHIRSITRLLERRKEDPTWGKKEAVEGQK